jgi:hypothetical protein
MARALIAAGIAVALNTTGDPVRPAEEASIDTVPAVLSSVTVMCPDSPAVKADTDVAI